MVLIGVLETHESLILNVPPVEGTLLMKKVKEKRRVKHEEDKLNESEENKAPMTKIKSTTQSSQLRRYGG